MPTFYGIRKSSRAIWTQRDLDNAIKQLQDKNVSIRKAALDNNIPEKTLRTRLKQKKFVKGALGRKCHLGDEAEEQLVQHIVKLQSVGFAPTRKNLRKIAYNLSEKMKLKQTFNTEKKIAGSDWYKSFMKRNPTLSVRKAGGTSNARASAMNKQEIKNYFHLLQQFLNDKNVMNKPSNIYNMDETGLQLNNEPDLVAAKGSKNIQVHQCTERGETITVVACCNAEGSFLPPYCIFKGVKMQQIWEENMPPGSIIQMRKESAYINEGLFMDWLENHFIPRKSAGSCLLILDGHGSHINSPDMLQMAIDNDVNILCLPSHTTHYLQPLDRSFFKPLKTYFRDACREWGNANPTKKIGRIHFGTLLVKAWSQAATSQTGISGFRVTGIYPFCPSAIPQHAYLENTITEHDEESSSSESDCDKKISPVTINDKDNLTIAQMCILSNESMMQPGPSNLCQQSESSLSLVETNIKTSQILNEVSPIPKTAHVPSLRKQFAMIVTTSKMINLKREKRRSKELTVNKIDSSEKSEYECIECYEFYNNTSFKADWIECIKYKKWLHETCTLHNEICNACKRVEFKKAKEDTSKKRVKDTGKKRTKEDSDKKKIKIKKEY